MLHEFKSSYAEIAKHFPELAGKLSPSAHKRQQLLDMARRGEPKPKFGSSSGLGEALHRLTREKSESYDPAFVKEIRSLAPDWLLTATETNKRLLLDMAKRKEPRPHHKTKIGAALCRYTSKWSGRYDYYDPKFAREIKRIAPQWFVSPLEQKKKSLLEMAERGEPRPSRKTKIGTSLCTYTMKSYKCYDPKFDREIRRLRPDWFVPTSEKVGEKKRLLLEMAAKGKPRPKYKTSLGQSFYSYIKKTSGCYDPTFVNQVKKIAPHWLLTGPEENKARFLDMAKRKRPRPKRKIMMVLYRYVCKSAYCYDPKFAREIKRLAPHWFRKPS